MTPQRPDLPLERGLPANESYSDYHKDRLADFADMSEQRWERIHSRKRCFGQ
jgi:hypothetical protein